jgi:hypothetical protein
MDEQMSQFVVVCYGKELTSTFKLTPLMLIRFTRVKSLQIICGVNVATLNWIELTRPVRDMSKSSSLVLQ